MMKREGDGTVHVMQALILETIQEILAAATWCSTHLKSDDNLASRQAHQVVDEMRVTRRRDLHSSLKQIVRSRVEVTTVWISRGENLFEVIFKNRFKGQSCECKKSIGLANYHNEWLNNRKREEYINMRSHFGTDVFRSLSRSKSWIEQKFARGECAKIFRSYLKRNIIKQKKLLEQ